MSKWYKTVYITYISSVRTRRHILYHQFSQYKTAYINCKSCP